MLQENNPADERHSWHVYFMEIAELAASRSTCLRRKVGAVATDSRHRIIGTGYNGAPSGMVHCTKHTCVRIKNKIPSGQQLELCKAIHAEQNLVVHLGERLKGATIYCTTRPCTTCTKLLIGCGVTHIVWLNNYDDEYATSLIKELGWNIAQDENGFYHATAVDSN